jgi:hypothetical protein
MASHALGLNASFHARTLSMRELLLLLCLLSCIFKSNKLLYFRIQTRFRTRCAGKAARCGGRKAKRRCVF